MFSILLREVKLHHFADQKANYIVDPGNNQDQDKRLKQQNYVEQEDYFEQEMAVDHQDVVDREILKDDESLLRSMIL